MRFASAVLVVALLSIGAAFAEEPLDSAHYIYPARDDSDARGRIEPRRGRLDPAAVILIGSRSTRRSDRAGQFDARADVALRIDAPTYVTVASEDNTVMVVQRPDGQISCIDDLPDGGANATALLEAPGQHLIWAGRKNEEDFGRLTLWVSRERAGPASGGIQRTDTRAEGIALIARLRRTVCAQEAAAANEDYANLIDRHAGSYYDGTVASENAMMLGEDGSTPVSRYSACIHRTLADELRAR